MVELESRETPAIKPRIMLVEDEKVVAADIEECIRGLGYDVAGSAASGAEAIRLADRARPDLVLMDIKLRGATDGIEVAGHLYEEHKIPVVYLTAHADAEILRRAKHTAPAGYVLKPFDERSLRTAIEIAFDRHGRERALVEAGERLTAAIGNIDEAVIVTRANGEIAVMNQVAESLTGWKAEQAIGKTLREVFTMLDPHTGKPQAFPAGRVLREGISIGLGEGVLLSRTGSRAMIQGSAAPVADGRSHAVGVCLLFRAINRRARDEQWGAPEHSSASRMEMLGHLTTGVAETFTRLLAARRGRTRATRLAQRLLEFGRRQPGVSADLDLNELVRELEDLLECALGDQIELRVSLNPSAGRAKGDAGQIELLLMHLALSARASGNPGTFAIEMSAAEAAAGDTYAVITVRPPDGSANAATDLPALDEILRQSAGETRVTSDGGVVRIYLPA